MSEKSIVERTNRRGRQARKCRKEGQERRGCGMKVDSRTNLLDRDLSLMSDA